MRIWTEKIIGYLFPKYMAIMRHKRLITIADGQMAMPLEPIKGVRVFPSPGG